MDDAAKGNSEYCLVPTNIVVWFLIFITGAAVFAIFRFIFMITYWETIKGSSLTDVLYAFWLGFRFDSVILCYVIGPLLLLSLLPFVSLTKKWVRSVIIIILTIIFTLIFLVSTVDLRFFDYFGSRMNFWAVEYIEYPGLIIRSSAEDVHFWKMLIIWLTTSLMFFLAIIRILKAAANRRRRCRKIAAFCMYLLAILIIGYGIRGRTGMKALDWGTAYFSGNHLLNQLALNSTFTLTHSIYEEIKDGESLFGRKGNRFHFYDDDDAQKTVAAMLGRESGSGSDQLGLEYHTIKKSGFGFLPNIIIVLMESWSADRIGALGSNLSISPQFDRLCAHGILFDNFYASGIRTNRGIPAVLCSFPSLPGRSIMKRFAADYPFRSIARILDDQGYVSIFAYGGDIEFDNMRGFLKAVGYDKFFSEDDFDNKDRLGKWGVADHILFRRLVREIRNLPRPFNLSVLTLSNHDPYLIPDNRFRLYDDTLPDGKAFNAFYYSDWALGQFIDSLKQYPVFDSTIFIFTADHCAHQSSKYMLDPNKFRVPLLIYGPAILGDQPRLVKKTASQVDILPTLVGMLGIETDMYCWGRDIFAIGPDDTGFAVIVQDEKTGLIEGRTFYFHWINIARILFLLDDIPYLKNDFLPIYPEIGASMEKRLNSYLQLANYLSRGGKAANPDAF
jgi:phosphoglycerol transferase MdoB-like AlkP superfamily enzyme